MTAETLINLALNSNDITTQSKQLITHFKENYLALILINKPFHPNLKRTDFQPSQYDAKCTNVIINTTENDLYGTSLATTLAHEVDHFYLMSIAHNTKGLESDIRAIEKTIRLLRTTLLQDTETKETKIHSLKDYRRRILYSLYGSYLSFNSNSTVADIQLKYNEIDYSTIKEFIAIMNQEPLNRIELLKGLSNEKNILDITTALDNIQELYYTREKIFSIDNNVILHILGLEVTNQDWTIEERPEFTK